MQFRAGAAPRWHRYAGRDFRQCQWIRRKAARWGQHYAAMEPGERLALLAVEAYARISSYLVLAAKASMSLYSKWLCAIDAGEDSSGGGPLARIRPGSCNLRPATARCASFSRLQQAFTLFTKRPVLLAENGF